MLLQMSRPQRKQVEARNFARVWFQMWMPIPTIAFKNISQRLKAPTEIKQTRPFELNIKLPGSFSTWNNGPSLLPTDTLTLKHGAFASSPKQLSVRESHILIERASEPSSSKCHNRSHVRQESP